MEYFFYEDRFCTDAWDLMSELDIAEEDVPVQFADILTQFRNKQDR